MKNIVIYFSRVGENYFDGKVKKIEKGNTEFVAEIISKIIESDIFKIEPVVEYSEDYYKCTQEAKRDLETNARPKIKSIPENIEQYDRIFLGYTNYWGTMPMCMFTLLESIDTSNKIILPFCTHEGSKMGNSERDILLLCKNSEVKKGISIYGSKVKYAQKDLIDWINSNISK